MFDIGFWEILLIGVVTLLVVGPDRLPGLAVFVGHWVGRLRRFANHMRDEISEELEAEHLKKLLHEQNQELDELRRDVDHVRREARGETVERRPPGGDRAGAGGDTDSGGDTDTGGDTGTDEMHATDRDREATPTTRRDDET